MPRAVIGNRRGKQPGAKTKKQSLWARLRPGLITGAADDDPSGIATYSQVGAGFDYAILWTAFFTFPLMVGIQTVSAGIGRVTVLGWLANTTMAAVVLAMFATWVQ